MKAIFALLAVVLGLWAGVRPASAVNNCQQIYNNKMIVCEAQRQRIDNYSQAAKIFGACQDKALDERTCCDLSYNVDERNRSGRSDERWRVVKVGSVCKTIEKIRDEVNPQPLCRACITQCARDFAEVGGRSGTCAALCAKKLNARCESF